MNRVLTCFAEASGDRWEAICLDLDIAVEGESFDQVRRDLMKAIRLHFEFVATLPEAERGALTHRPAPLAVRLGYAWRFIVGAMFPRRRLVGADRAEFAIPSPA